MDYDVKLLWDFGHGVNTPGKRSPDGRLLEYEYVRQVGQNIVTIFDLAGFDNEIIVPEVEDIPLADRVARVNRIVDANPGRRCLLCSIHVNAAGSGKTWMNARGWSVFVCKNASDKSKALASSFYKAAVDLNVTTRKPLPTQPYWESDLYILKKTKCPAILTENFFQDNRDDVEFLLSKSGRTTVENIHLMGINNYLGLPYALVKP